MESNENIQEVKESKKDNGSTQGKSKKGGGKKTTHEVIEGLKEDTIKKKKEDKALESIVIEGKLTPRQKLFCEIYSSDREFFGNGVQSYIEAYDIDLSKGKGAYYSAKTCAGRLLSNVFILAEIDSKIDISINDRVVDKELAKIIKQDAEFNPKIRAINEYNKVKGRHEPERKEITFKDSSDEELKRRAAEALEGISNDTGGTKDKEVRELIDNLRPE